MKILVLTTSFPRYPNDYIAPFLFELFNEIKQLKHEVVILAPQMKDASRFQKINNLEIIRINYSNDPKKQVLGDGFLAEHLKESNSNKFNLAKFMIKTLRRALNLHKKNNFDLIHTQWVFPMGFFGLILKYIINRPLIITVHGAGVFLAKKYSFLKPFIKLSLKKADLIIFNSSNTRIESIKIQNKIKNEKIIHPGINIERFTSYNIPTHPDRELFEKNDVILTIGRLIERKGFQYLIKAMKKLSTTLQNIKLIIIGTGPLENKLKELVKKLNLQGQIFFLGEVKGEYIPYFYANSKLFVLPSIIDKEGDTEGLGIVLLEAMASGVPVIGTNVGGINDIIKHKHNGLLVKQKKPKEIAEAIEKILKDKNLSKELSLNALNTIKKNFKWSKIANMTLKEYRNLIKK
ncbi:MAG: glycosyltransferase family 4 protein [Candidatus Lokiarchaeota archaeon]|nr:glycosyltransferase family 4 protein [Candidatus Lokiarchaeota archaeon]